MEIQWYPGHMAKARREIGELLPLLDIILEIADARLPSGSRNPDLNELTAGKPRILLLNKIDLAEEKKTDYWVDFFHTNRQPTVKFNARTGEGLAQLEGILNEQSKPGNKKGAVKTGRLRMGVVGIPNVGKSSVLNRLVGKGAAKVGNRPGVTRGRQWVKKGRFEILDTPGLLWPKITDPEVGWLLAFTGAVRPEILDIEELAFRLLEMLRDKYPSSLSETYGIDLHDSPEILLERIGAKRGCLIKGGKVDRVRAANMIWTDFRTGRLGRFTLEDPPLLSVSP